MRRLISSLLAVLLLGVMPCAALAGQPGIPEAFHGRATGAAGTVISAVIGGSVVASTTVATGGVYGYAPSLFLIPDPAANRNGTSISFLLGTTSLATAVFKNGAITALDLLIPGSTTTEATTSTSTPPQEPEDTSTTTITIATTTASASSSGSGGSGGGAAIGATPASSPSAPAVQSSGSTHAKDTIIPAHSSLPISRAMTFKVPNAVHIEEGAGLVLGENLPGPAQPSSRSLPLAAAVALASAQVFGPLWILAAYLAGVAFFLYALVYRLRRLRAAALP